MYQSAVLHWSRYDIADKFSWGKQSKYEQVNSWFLEQRFCASKQTLVILIRYPLFVFKGTLSYPRCHIITICAVVLHCICVGICFYSLEFRFRMDWHLFGVLNKILSILPVVRTANVPTVSRMSHLGNTWGALISQDTSFAGSHNFPNGAYLDKHIPPATLNSDV